MQLYLKHKKRKSGKILRMFKWAVHDKVFIWMSGAEVSHQISAFIYAVSGFIVESYWCR